MLATSCSIKDPHIKFGPYSFYKSAVQYVNFDFTGEYNYHEYDEAIMIHFSNELDGYIGVNKNDGFYSDALSALHKAGF